MQSTALKIRLTAYKGTYNAQINNSADGFRRIFNVSSLGWKETNGYE